ncbi:metalloprotease [Yersinia frederiksenii]|nr:hypothetical protein [Yersinia frederiksenii]CQJ04567.1 metalloprotease [Yersinia frederiksenii]
MRTTYEHNSYNISTDQQTRIAYKNKVKEEIAKEIVTEYTLNGRKQYGMSTRLTFSFTHPTDKGMIHRLRGNLISLFSPLQTLFAEKLMQSWSDVANISYSK